MSFEYDILNFIQTYLSNPIMDKLMVFISHLGDMGFIWIVFAAILIINKKYRKIGYLLILTLLVTTLIGESFLKNVIGRTRPFHGVDIQLLIAEPSSFSFPSGHTASSFAAATLLSNYFKKYAWLFILLALLIAFSRMYLFVHFPTDILGGVILGCLSAYLIIKIYNYKTK